VVRFVWKWELLVIPLTPVARWR